MSDLIPVVLAGGSGTRLWPLSRKSYPKQFQRLLSERSLLQTTLARASALTQQAPIVVCHEDHRFTTAEQLREVNLKHQGILLEPEGRNTAPAIAVAALHALSLSDNPTLLVMPADHHIESIDAFTESAQLAAHLAQSGRLVCLGARATKAHTGYGYIEQGEQIQDLAFTIKQFVEKPDQATAESYLKQGNFLWNCGIFVFKAKAYLDALKELAPDVLASSQSAYRQAQHDLDFIRLENNAFQGSPNISIDYAVMEHTSDPTNTLKGAVVQLDTAWSDIGDWNELWQTSDKNEDGNALFGDVTAQQTQDSLIHAHHRLVTTIGVKDLIIIETSDAVLIADKAFTQQLKALIEQLEGNQRTELLAHSEVSRPWGKYDIIDLGHGYQVKRITVNPQQRISMQRHQHRAEHWVVVSGTAKVTLENEVYTIHKNESTFIPVGAIHCLENPTDTPLELIEIQSGEYLGEDDIERFNFRN